MLRWICMALVTVVLVAGCSSAADNESTPAETPTADSSATPTAGVAAGVGTSSAFGDPPPVREGDLDPEVLEAARAVVNVLTAGVNGGEVLKIGQSDDVRMAWFLSDLMRFTSDPSITSSVANLTGIEEPTWGTLTDHLIAWDIPAPPNYVELKAGVFTAADQRWSFVFDDPGATIDYRYLSWGGVLVDDRPLGDDQPCRSGCIPALDDPATTPASGGDWYPDDAIVFGVVINGEARAYPKNQMEVHEMVNDTVGGRRIGMPYCTLCLSAQVWFTDELPDGVEPIVLRTSGLLSRSNKVMFDLTTYSVFDTFQGRAVSGPLLDIGLELDQAAVITTTWGEWKAEYPDTTILAEDGGLGRTYSLDPLRGRDDNGPIFPVGEVDPRLTVHDRVLTVLTLDGTPVAFPVGAASLAIEEGTEVTLEGVSVAARAGGLIASINGAEVASHEAFWFAWSQFHPDTLLWLP